MKAGELLRAEDLGFAYGRQRPVLSDVSFTLAPGENTALLGSNGSGKTTLLLLLTGLLRGEGHLIVEGQPLDKKHLAAQRRRMGIVFQHAEDQLFCPTVADNVAFSLVQRGVASGEVAQRVSRALDGVGLTGFEERPVQQLSPGEQRRAALASVLVEENSLLLLDEPSGGLDPRGRRELIGLLECRGETLLVASHDLELVRSLCHRALVLHEGRLAWEGLLKELLEDPPTLREFGLL